MIYRTSIFRGGTGIMSDLYREKNPEKISSPEQLNDYIHVTTPSIWLVLIALLLLLAGMIAWSILGTVEVTTEDGQTKTVHPIVFVTN